MNNKIELGNGEELFRIAREVNFTEPIESKELQIEVDKLINDLNKRANANDAFSLLHSLSRLGIQKVFYNAEDAENLIQDLKKYKISIPHFVANCKKEVEIREKFIENKKNYEFTETEKKEKIKKLENDWFDRESKLKTIKENLYELKEQFQGIEKKVLSIYNFDISELYEPLIKDAKAEGLNDYFFYTQLHIQKIDIENVALLLINYFDFKKEYYFLREELNLIDEAGNNVKSKNEKVTVKGNIHPSHNSLLWNNNAYELFKYLFDEYYLPNPKKQKLIYIYFFIQEQGRKNSNGEYFIFCTKDKYFKFLKENYNLFPTNKDKRDNYEKQEIIMAELLIKFENTSN